MKPASRIMLLTGAVFALTAFLSASAVLMRLQEVAPAEGGKLVLSLEPAQSKVRWTLGSTLHTVHGTFAFARGNVQFDSAAAKASGEIVVNAASGESGNDSRDKKMHGEILESGKFGQIVFRPRRAEGKLAASGASTLQVQGVLVLHGGEHEMETPVQMVIAGKRWKGTARFNVPYMHWGLKNPSNFLLKVKPDVEIELEMAGSLESAAD